MTTAKKPPAQSLARLIAKPGRAGEAAFELPSRALRIGDPWTEGAGRVELGVDRVSIFLLDVGFGDDRAAIVVRVRPSVAVRWEIGASGGVDTGVFAVWDADSRRTGDAPTEVSPGACELGGRRVFALETGDGGFPCVIGRDERGEIAALVAGPGVDPARFGASVREEDLSPAERAERAAEEARAERLGGTDLLASALGEERASPPLRWFLAGWMESLPEGERAVARERLLPALAGLSLPVTERKAKERAKADSAALLAWALSGWATVLAATLPEAAARLVMGESIDKKKMDWASALGRVFDREMSDHRFDLGRPFEAQFSREAWEAWSREGEGREPALRAALRDVPPDLATRFGLTGLGVMVEKTKPHDQLANAFWYAARGLEPSLALHVLATRAADLARVEGGAPEGGAPLRPREPSYVEALLARVEGPIELLLRLARRGR